MRANEPVALLQPLELVGEVPASGDPAVEDPPVVPPLEAPLSQTEAEVQAGVHDVSEQVWFS